MKQVKILKKFWDCRQVSNEFLDHLEMVLDGVIREFIHTFPLAASDVVNNNPLVEGLIKRNAVRRKLILGLRERMKWVKITDIDDAAVDCVSKRFACRIDNIIGSHPSKGKRLMV
jgi:hypothetical protein